MADAASELADLLRSLRLSERERRRERTLTGAAVGDDVERVRVFLDAGADVEERSIGFASPLQAAAGAGRLPVVELLLERGADPREKPEAVFSPLSAAAGHGQAAVVRALIRAIGDLAGETKAVAQAAAHGRVECLELLLGAGAPVGEHAGHTLRLAARGGHLGCVRRLLSAGVDPRAHPDYARDLFGDPVDPPYLPRQAALDNGHAAVARVLDGEPLDAEAERQHDAQRPEPPSLADLARALRGGAGGEREEPVSDEARAAALARALALVGAAGTASVVRAESHPWLVLAADSGETALVTALIERGAAVDAAGEDRRTPLMAAAEGGDLASVQALLAAGADPRVRVRGRSAAGYATGPHKRAIKALIAEAQARAVPRP